MTGVLCRHVLKAWRTRTNSAPMEMVSSLLAPRDYSLVEAGVGVRLFCPVQRMILTKARQRPCRARKGITVIGLTPAKVARPRVRISNTAPRLQRLRCLGQ